MTRTSLEQLESKISERDFILGVIGLGYVGLPLSLTFLKKGIKIISKSSGDIYDPVLKNSIETKPISSFDVFIFMLPPLFVN